MAILTSSQITFADLTDRSIVSISVEYSKSTSSTTAPTSGWSATTPTWENGKFIWTRIKTTYNITDPTTNLDYTISNPICATGSGGSNGNSLFITYHDNAANSTPATPTGNGTLNGWHTTVTAASVWISQKVAASVSSGTWGTPVRIKGTDGRGVVSITKQYYLSTSNSTQAGGSWADTAPAYDKEKYLWSREKTVFSDSSTPVYTTAVIDEEWSQLSTLGDLIDNYNIIYTEQFSNVQTDISKNNDSIVASVTKIQGQLFDTVDENGNVVAEGKITQIEKSVQSKMDSDSVTIAISSAISEGVDKVVTKEKGFRFDDNGLTINDSNSEMTTNIDEDGMSIFRNNEEVLTADNTGVNAINLTARQYLIIGTHSRLEDFGSRTACFWIG